MISRPHTTLTTRSIQSQHLEWPTILNSFDHEKTTLVAATLLSMFASLNVVAQDKPVVVPQVTSEWHGSVSPYLWGVNVTGALSYDQSKLGMATLGTGQLLQDLNLGGMLSGHFTIAELLIGTLIAFDRLSAVV